MESVLFTKDECSIILNGIENNEEYSLLNIDDRKYEEWLIVDKSILDMVLNKLKRFGITSIKEGRILKYDKGCFFKKHVDTWEKYPHRYKTIIVQLSNGDSYEGGNMMYGDVILGKEIGNTVMFEGTLPHSMGEITSGIRYAFVIWLERNDFGINKTLL